MVKIRYSKLYRFPAWALKKFFFKLLSLIGFDFEIVVTPMRLGYKMRIDYTIPYQKRSMLSGQYDDLTIIKLASMIPRDGTIFDVGANIGYYSCSFSKLIPKGKVYAFEAVEKTFNRLSENIALNGDGTKAYHIALGDKEGMLRLHVDKQGDTSNAVGEHTMGQDDIDRSSGTVVETPMTTIDRLVDKENIERCDFIKIDVEGAELLVFSGASQLLEKHRPIIYGEFNSYWLGQTGKSIQDVHRFFSNLDYVAYKECLGKITQIDPQNIPVDVEYLFIPKEKV